MVRLCDEIREGDSAFNARMYTQWTAYRGLPNPPYLYRVDEGAQLLLCDGVLTIDGVGFDAEELRRFAVLCGCRTITCAGEAAARLAPLGTATTTARVMRYVGELAVPSPQVCTEPRLDDVFPLLQATFENMGDAVFERWYSDVSLKIRRGLAYVYAVYGESTGEPSVEMHECRQNADGQAEHPEEMLRGAGDFRRAECSKNAATTYPNVRRRLSVATAGVYYQNAATAVIGSVATTPEQRGRGLAGKLLQTLISRIQSEKRIPQIICLNDQAHRLYSRLGFAEIGEFCEIKL